MNVSYQNGWPVPAGWRFVPDEPTNEMYSAGWRARYLGDDALWDVYRTMLAAAPEPPAAPQAGQDDEMVSPGGTAPSDETLRLAGIIADKIEDGTLFRAGFFSRRDLADKVRAVVRAARPAAQPAVGEEIHVHIEGQDVLTLPLASSGIDNPRFVVHVPGQPDPNVCYGDGFHDGYLKGRGEGWDAALAAQNPEDAQDAARYRWLRNHGFQSAWAELGSDLDGDPFVCFVMRVHIPEPTSLPYEEQEWTAGDTDAAIDAAIAAKDKLD